MTNKQKLELTWIREKNHPRREPRIRIELAEDPQREDSPVRCHEAILAICQGPRCRCFDVRVQWLPAPTNAPARPAREFWFNLDETTILLTPELQQAPESLRLAEILRTELTKADQRQLREWFLAKKLAIIQTTPPSEIDIANLPNADDGAMIGFVDVFPFGLALNFTWNKEVWAVSEQYCVQPGCKCKEMVLSFLKLIDAVGRKTTKIEDAPSLRYNYHTQTFKPVVTGAAGSPSLDSLLAVLKREYASLNTQLEFRQRLMQSLYARHYLARTKARLPSQPGKPLSAVAHKIGRNDPCPCGSGRKYKHCCGNKPRA